MANATVEITCADGRPLSALTKLLEQRGKWLNETAEQSVRATMVDVLVSLRAITKMAKPKKEQIKLALTSLKPSFTGGKRAPEFCLRDGKTRYIPSGKVRIGRASGIMHKDFKNCQVWRWDDFKGRKWLIVARNEKQAQNWAYNKVKVRAKRFKGLARLAMTKLIAKSGSANPQGENGESHVRAKAESLTKVQHMGAGNQFSISAEDLLNYAKLALIGGE